MNDVPTISILLNEGESNEQRIAFTKRNLIEYNITDIIADLIEERGEKIVYDSTIRWLEANSKASPRGRTSMIPYYVFPIFTNVAIQEQMMKECPSEFVNIFKAAFQVGEIQKNTTDDSGYLLLYYVR